MATQQVSVTRVVTAPPEKIFALLVDPSKHPLLDGSGTVKAYRAASPSRLGLHSRFSMSMRLVVPYAVTNEVVEFEEGRLIAWQHFGGHRWRWRLEPNGDGTTTVTETFDWSTSRAPHFIERRGYPARNEAGMVATLERLQALVGSGSPGTAHQAS